MVNTPYSLPYYILHIFTHTYVHTYVHYSSCALDFISLLCKCTFSAIEKSNQSREVEWEVCLLKDRSKYGETEKSWSVSYITQYKKYRTLPDNVEQKMMKQNCWGRVLQGMRSAVTWCELSGSLGHVDGWDFSWTKWEKRSCVQQINWIGVDSNLYIALL